MAIFVISMLSSVLQWLQYTGRQQPLLGTVGICAEFLASSIARRGQNRRSDYASLGMKNMQRSKNILGIKLNLHESLTK